MAGTLRDAIDRLLADHRRGATLVLLFDYDGTLVPLARHPACACLPRETRHLLGALGGRPRVIVGIVSGRSLRDLRRMVGLPDLAYAGTGGLELQVGRTVLRPPRATRAPALVSRVARDLLPALSQFRGAWVERKPLGLAIHYRAVAPRHIPAVCAAVRRLLAPFADALRLVAGPMALEVIPNLGWTKGTAVRVIASRAAPARPSVFYAGDAPGDRDAFAATRELGGVCVGVGAGAPREAPYRVRTPEALLGVLEQLLRGLSRSAQ